MSALRPMFAAAGILLLIALIMLGVRSGDDTAVPTAGGTVSPGETTTEDVSPLDEPTTVQPSPDEPTEDEPTTDATATDEPTTDDETTSPSGDGTSGTDGTGSDDGASGSDDGTSGSDDGTSGSDDGGEGTGGSGSVDDMPETGGGVAGVIGGMLALGATAGLLRRR